MAIYPFAYVGDDAVIGDGTTLHPGAVIGDGCQLGRDCIIHPNAVLYQNVVLGDRVEIHAGSVLGGDGFGYRQIDGRHVKIPHSGRLEVDNDVEVGSNCTIDRATFEATRIGEGTKIDNLVMIGHNNQIGRHNLLCGQVGIAGSCKTGDYVVMAGQAGIKDNTQIGDRVVVGAQAGVHRNVPDGQQVLGSPAIPVREQRRIFQMIARLPEMHRQLRELTAQVAALTAGRRFASGRRDPDAGNGPVRGSRTASATPVDPSWRMSISGSGPAGPDLVPGGAAWCERDRPEEPVSARARSATRGRREPIGLLAGSGRFPILFAEAARRQGLQVACVGIKYEALRGAARALRRRSSIVGVAKLGRMIRPFAARASNGSSWRAK